MGHCGDGMLKCTCDGLVGGGEQRQPRNTYAPPYNNHAPNNAPNPVQATITLTRPPRSVSRLPPPSPPPTSPTTAAAVTTSVGNVSKVSLRPPVPAVARVLACVGQGTSTVCAVVCALPRAMPTSVLLRLHGPLRRTLYVRICTAVVCALHRAMPTSVVSRLHGPLRRVFLCAHLHCCCVDCLERCPRAFCRDLYQHGSLRRVFLCAHVRVDGGHT